MAINPASAGSSPSAPIEDCGDGSLEPAPAKNAGVRAGWQRRTAVAENYHAGQRRGQRIGEGVVDCGRERRRLFSRRWAACFGADRRSATISARRLAGEWFARVFRRRSFSVSSVLSSIACTDRSASCGRGIVVGNQLLQANEIGVERLGDFGSLAADNRSVGDDAVDRSADDLPGGIQIGQRLFRVPCRRRRRAIAARAEINSSACGRSPAARASIVRPTEGPSGNPVDAESRSCQDDETAPEAARAMAPQDRPPRDAALLRFAIGGFPTASERSWIDA